jgi:probable rRNA maturation factor
MKKLPLLHLHNRQRKIRLPLERLRRRLDAALQRLPRSGASLPAQIEISLVGSAAIARVHAEFFRDPTPTDVITFPHGEILICPEVAKKQARRFSLRTDEEVFLYGVHGFLHLLGWSDTTPAGFEKMRRTQERIFRDVLRSEAAAQ